MNKITIKIECPECGGTGVYTGMCEPTGQAVVCVRCNGAGAVNFEYIPFTGRKHKNGINVVRWSRGSFIATGCGPTGGSISYQDFCSGKLPPR